MSKKPLVIWFEANGDMLDQGYGYVSNSYGYKSEEAKDFSDHMEVIKLQEFRKKNTRVVFRSVISGRKYSMFADDFNELLSKKLVNNLQVAGTFRFLKKGSGQAIKLVIP